MVQNTRGILLRTIKYGESSLIVTVFTEQFGVQAYLLQGIRSTKKHHSCAAILQTGALLDLVVFQQPLKNLQRIREFQLAYMYTGLQESMIKNAVSTFTNELLLRMLPENATFPALFDFTFHFLKALDNTPTAQTSNYPLFFIINCCHLLGYETTGYFTADTPHLNIMEGGFSNTSDQRTPQLTEAEGAALNAVLSARELDDVIAIQLNSRSRFRLLEWYILFLQHHTQHNQEIRSLTVLRSVFH